MNQAPLLEVAIDAGYTTTPILRDLRFALHPGQTLGLVGVSGAGKSTVLLSLLGLLPSRGGWVRGTVQYQQQQLIGMPTSQLRRLRGREIALIPQSPLSALSPVLKLETHFREAWLAHEPRNDKRMQTRIREVLNAVQLPFDPAFLKRRPSGVSVGQAQRILIALALLHQPKLIIADEPTSALDPVSRMEILSLLSRLTGHGKAALLYVSHDLLSVLQLCEKVAVLHQGSIVNTCASAQIAHTQCPHTLYLLRSLPLPLHAPQANDYATV